MRKKLDHLLLAAVFCALALNTGGVRAQQQDDQELLKAREAVWRAYFAGDLKALEEMVPPETIVMSGGEERWRRQADVLRSAGEFHAQGGKLIRLEFPRTEVQHFGDVAIIWSSYIVETEKDGKRTSGSSRVTEVFVRQHGHWTNPGWHTDEEK
jgi:ketosteroid isomerase-like protein